MELQCLTRARVVAESGCAAVWWSIDSKPEREEAGVPRLETDSAMVDQYRAGNEGKSR